MGGEYEFLGHLPRPWNQLVDRESSLCLIKKAGDQNPEIGDSNPYRHQFGSALERVNGWLARLPT
jgi:hypothetical protein